jgi:hypothetical protein
VAQELGDAVELVLEPLVRGELHLVARGR